MGVEELIGSFRDAGLSQVICTDIAKDGMLSGPSVPLYLQLQKTFPEIDITVSGGISSISKTVKPSKASISSNCAASATRSNWDAGMPKREPTNWFTSTSARRWKGAGLLPNW